MLIEFSVANFQSIAEKQTFSMVASSSKNRRAQHSFASGSASAEYLLRSSCIMGPNGVGKSSFVEAAAFVRDFVAESSKETQEGESINVTPFKLDKELRDSPSEFEISFIHDTVQYQYGFTVDKNRVHEEWLFANPNDPKKRTRTIFQRVFNSDEHKYYWDIKDNNLKGPKELWKNATRDNALFLSTAVQLKSVDLQPPFEWLQSYFKIISSPARLSSGFTKLECIDSDKRNAILLFMQSADIPISGFEIDEEDFDVNSISSKLPKPFRDDLKKTMSGQKIASVKTLHIDRNNKEITLDLDEESDGTNVLFSLAGPMLDVLENGYGYTLILDELHNSLHPLALKYLVECFHDPEKNKNNAQLIFTTHDTSMLDRHILHRDQIWFMEKKNKSTTLYPLKDFKIDEKEARQKRYLDGRYGGIPIV